MRCEALLGSAVLGLADAKGPFGLVPVRPLKYTAGRSQDRTVCRSVRSEEAETQILARHQ